MSKLAIAMLTFLLVFGVDATGTPKQAGPASCGSDDAPAPGTVTNGSVHSGGIERHYRVAVPESYVPGRAAPLVLALHGRGGDPVTMEHNSGLSRLAAIVVYPEALVAPDGQTAWSGAPYSPEVDDVAFAADLIDRLSAQLCVNADQVFAVGLSNGGGMAAILGCRLADRLAGYATVAGAFYPEAGQCHPARPLPLVNIHGLADDVVPYEGNPAKGQPPVQQWMDERAALNRCTGRAPVETPLPGVERERWTGCAAPVAHYRLLDGGHVWPQGIDTPELIWSFFQNAV